MAFQGEDFPQRRERAYYQNFHGKVWYQLPNLFLATIGVWIALEGFNSLSAEATFSEDVDTLLQLKEALDPGGYSPYLVYTWNSTYNCTYGWYGLYCSNITGRVTSIVLNNQYLAGSIPSDISKLTSLETLDLSSNYLNGTIPDSVGELSNLTYLYLYSNYISGPIPENITNLQKLKKLGLYGNILSGFIPTNIGKLNLTFLSIGSNRLSGAIPESLYSMTYLKTIYADSNELSGTISGNVSNLTSLVVLSVRENQLSGGIPDAVYNLTNLVLFDVSDNYFNGDITKYNSSEFFRADIGLNCFNSSVDSSQRTAAECESFCNSTQAGGPCGGNGICSSTGASANCTCFDGYMTFYDRFNCQNTKPPAPPPPPSSGFPTYAIVIIVIVVVTSVTVIGILLFCLLTRNSPARHNSFDKQLMGQFAQSITFQVLSSATNNFSEDNLLGVGGFGKVYKGISPDGEVWAVKRATNITAESAADFQREVNAISTMFHRSILSLRGYCNENGEGILVYAFMVNGSLKDVLHNKGSMVGPLSLAQRIRIALGTAEGLHYLHDQARPTVIHRDVKSDNILLDEDLNAHVADFGFLKGNTTGGTRQLVGTPGYIDPEYCRTFEATTKSDVYSFGVLLLELITGLPAIFILGNDDSESGTTTLVSHVHDNLEWDVDKMTDKTLRGHCPAGVVESLVALADKCVSKLGVNRPTMQEVCATLVNIQVTMASQEDGVLEEGRGSQGGQIEMDFHSIEVSERGGSIQTFALPSVGNSFMRLR